MTGSRASRRAGTAAGRSAHAGAPLLRFDGAVERDPAVARWFADRPGPLGETARAWFGRMRGCGPEVVELVHDGCPVVCVEDAPFSYVNAFRSHVNVGFFRGASLDDPAGLLEGAGKSMRHVKLRPGEAVDAAALDDLIRAAHADVRARLAVETQPSTRRPSCR